MGARVTSQPITIYFDEPIFLRPAVLTCCVQLWLSWVGAGSNNDDDSGAAVFPVNNQVLSIEPNVKYHVWLQCIPVVEHSDLSQNSRTFLHGTCPSSTVAFSYYSAVVKQWPQFSTLTRLQENKNTYLNYSFVSNKKRKERKKERDLFGSTNFEVNY